MPGKILVIDDNPPSLKLISEGLKHEKYEVFTAHSESTGISMSRKNHVDLIVLSLVNSDMDGPEICARLKKDPETAGIFILVLCLSDRAGQQLICRKAGADDYMIDVDADVDLFLVRCEGLLRRSHGPVIKRGVMTLISESREVWIAGVRFANLTQREFDVLHLLAKRSPRAVSGMTIYKTLWGGGEPPSRETLKGPRPDLRTVDVHIARLREKLLIKEWLKTKARGYRLLDVT